MILPDTMDVQDGRIVHGEGDQRHGGKEGKDDGCRGEGRQPLVAGDLLVLLTKIEADLPLENRLPEQSHDREHSSGRNPFGLLQPHRADGGRMLDPATPWFHGERLPLIGLEYLGICTALCLHGGR